MSNHTKKHPIIKNINKILDEIKDYFNKTTDEDYLRFNDHPLSDLESIMDPKKPAPWDHLSNDDDLDLDVEIKEKVKR